MNISGRSDQKTRRVWAILCLAVKKFLRIDGVQWAGAFAFNVFFSLFPLMVLLVTIASFFIDRDRAGKEVIAYMENYVPISGEMQRHIFDTIAGVIKARSMRARSRFHTGLGRPPMFHHPHPRDQPRLGHRGAQLVADAAEKPGAARHHRGCGPPGHGGAGADENAKAWLFTVRDFHSWMYGLGSFVIPLLVVFFSLSLFYRLAPRRPTRFAEVWAAALCATVLLRATESLFVIYLKKFATLNAVYGAFGGIMALLLWIYLSGCIFIFGACLCAAQADGRSATGVKQTTLFLGFEQFFIIKLKIEEFDRQTRKILLSMEVVLEKEARGLIFETRRRGA